MCLNIFLPLSEAFTMFICTDLLIDYQDFCFASGAQKLINQWISAHIKIILHHSILIMTLAFCCRRLHLYSYIMYCSVTYLCIMLYQLIDLFSFTKWSSTHSHDLFPVNNKLAGLNNYAHTFHYLIRTCSFTRERFVTSLIFKNRKNNALKI